MRFEPNSESEAESSETKRETDPDMAGYRRVGDRRGRLRFEVVGQIWGELETTESPPLRHIKRGEMPIETPVPLSPESAERARPGLDDHVDDVPVRARHPRSSPGADPPRSLTGPESLELPPATPEQTGRVVDAARTRATVQLLDISMSGALLASSQHVGVGRRAALRATLSGEPLAIEIQVQHVSPEVKSVHDPTRFQLGVQFVWHDDRSLRCVQRFLNQKPV